jgi:anti-anti-sigma factor
MRDEPLTVTAMDGKGDGVLVLALQGPLTLANIFLFQEEIARHEPRLLIVDLTESPYMDSAGLGSLMNAYVHAQKNGRRLVLAGANMRVNALLELTKVHLILKNYATVAEAEASAS